MSSNKGEGWEFTKIKKPGSNSKGNRNLYGGKMAYFTEIDFFYCGASGCKKKYAYSSNGWPGKDILA